MSKKVKVGHGYDRVVLVCQGGGALGAYYAGAYKAMVARGIVPGVVSGTSIGAITASMIAGSALERRVSTLESFWDVVSYPDFADGLMLDDRLGRMNAGFQAFQGAVFGQPSFFEPRVLPPQLQLQGTMEALSYYNTAPLKETLSTFVDFDRIRAKETRLILGAVQVKSGSLMLFDNTSCAIGPEHVMASGAMPPGFPPVIIDGDMYWDGGCVSQTLLDTVLHMRPFARTLCFVLDVFQTSGREPATMTEVLARSRELMQSTRTLEGLSRYAEQWHMGQALETVRAQLTSGALQHQAVVHALEKAECPQVDIVHCVYQPEARGGVVQDLVFSKAAVTSHMASGYNDLLHILEEAPWQERGHGEVPIYRYEGSVRVGSSIETSGRLAVS